MRFNRRLVNNQRGKPGGSMRHYPITVVKSRGFTALELIIVLVVGFSIIALSASKMGQLFSASTTTAAMGSILDLYSAARSLRGSGGYEGNLLESLITAQMVPKGLARTDKTLKNEWNGEIKIDSTTDALGFKITYPNVPVDACTKIAQNLLTSGTFLSVDIQGKTVKATDPVATIVTTCASNSGKAVKMIFLFSEGSDSDSDNG